MNACPAGGVYARTCTLCAQRCPSSRRRHAVRRLSNLLAAHAASQSAIDGHSNKDYALRISAIQQRLGRGPGMHACAGTRAALERPQHAAPTRRSGGRMVRVASMPCRSRLGRHLASITLGGATLAHTTTRSPRHQRSRRDAHERRAVRLVTSSSTGRAPRTSSPRAAGRRSARRSPSPRRSTCAARATC